MRATTFGQVLWIAAFLAVLPQIAGCCCCGGAFPPFDMGRHGTSDPETPPVDPALAKELETAREQANKALNRKGYPNAKSVDLRKDGLNWYVSGIVPNPDGGDAEYEVWFEVKIRGDRQQWAVKTIKIDGNVVYP